MRTDASATQTRLDIHRKFSKVTARDGQGKIAWRRRLGRATGLSTPTTHSLQNVGTIRPQAGLILWSRRSGCAAGRLSEDSRIAFEVRKDQPCAAAHT